MAKKYEPYLVGVAHSEEFASTVVGHILSLNVKSVGLEVSKSFLSLSEREVNASDLNFWLKIVNDLTSKGVRVIYLVPDPVRKRIDRESSNVERGVLLGKRVIKRKVGNIEFLMPVSDILSETNVKGLYAALVKDSLTRFMEKRILKEKPEAIVVGGGHALLMKDDLNIPKNKFRLFPHPRPSAHMQMLTRGIRRFQTERRKAREKRLAKLGKIKPVVKKPSRLRTLWEKTKSKLKRK